MTTYPTCPHGRIVVGRERCLECRVTKLEHALASVNLEICQTLGAALGYPKYSDDPKNFPDVPKDDPGVCVGEHIAETLASEAAKRIADLEAYTDMVRNFVDEQLEWSEAWECAGCGKIFAVSADPASTNDSSGDSFCDKCFDSWEWRCIKCSWRFRDATDICEDCGAEVLHKDKEQ